MSWNIQKPGDYINGPLTVAGQQTLNNLLAIRGTPTFPTSGVGLELFYSPTNLNSNIYSYNRTVSGWAELVLGSSNTIFQINGVNSAFLTTNGFGLGVNPNSRFHVLAADATTADLARFQQTNQGNLLIQSQQGGQSLGGANGILFSNATGRMGFRTNASSGDAQMLLDTGGNVLIGLVANNANGGCLQLKSGVSFPAAQITSTDANTLDDYEEGTFTPTIEGHTTAGTASYSVRLGQYSKIGRVVQFQLYVAWSSGTGTGQLKVTGLPFTGNGTYPAVLQVYPIDVSLVAGYYATASVPIGTSSVFLYQLPTGGGSDASIAYDAAGQLIITGTYTV